MRAISIIALVVTATALAGCSAGAASRAASPTVDRGGRSPTARPTPDERRLQDLLPAAFRRTEAHAFPVGQDMLDRLASALGIRRPALEAAYASDHGAAFVQMYALRASGHDAEELLDALSRAAYPTAIGSVTVEPAELAGRDVTVISEPTQAATLGTFYALVDGGTLIVAQALAEPVAEAAFDELPAQ